MKERIKKFIKKAVIILVLVISTTLFFALLDEKPTFADSGFSTSHSSGGSSHSSSSHSSSSHSSSSSGSGQGGIAGFIFVTVLFVILCIIFSKLEKKSNNRMPIDKKDDSLTEDMIKKVIPNFNKAEFLQNGFNIYCDIQNAWMNFKLDDVRDVLTDELYNMYESQLATLEVKGEQNIMKDFVLRSSYLKDFIAQNNNATITAVYVIEMYDYIADKSTGKLIRGVANRKMRVKYEMKFRMTLDENAKVENCPNCGAKVNINGSGVCEYCGSKIVADNTKWVLTEKKALDQIYL